LEEALNIFLEQSVHEQKIPFTVTENVPNEITLAAIESAQKDEDMYGPFESMDDLINALNS
jgi:DNA-damage-inducible protein J